MVPLKDAPNFKNYGRSWRAFCRVGSLVLTYLYDRLTLSRAALLTGGNALVGALVKAMLDNGATYYVNASVEALMTADGRVTGAQVRRDGILIPVRARRAVVLACGGFPHDKARRRAVYSESIAAREQPLAPQGNTGDGLRLGKSVGAKCVTNWHHPAAWTPVSEMPIKNGKKVAFPHFDDRAKAGFIIVDHSGRQFTNEAMPYPAVGKAMLDAAAAEDLSPAFFLVGDHETVRREGIGVVPPGPLPLGKFIRSGYLQKANSLTELAKKIDVDTNVLVQTVKDFNIGVERGEDPAFGRGGDAYQRAFGTRGHMPNPNLAPIRSAPFYAVQLVVGDLGTFAGLKTDACGRVLDEEDTPIGGLYAAGNDMTSVMGGTYPGAGISLGPAVTFGYLIAKDIVSKG